MVRGGSGGVADVGLREARRGGSADTYRQGGNQEASPWGEGAGAKKRKEGAPVSA